MISKAIIQAGIGIIAISGIGGGIAAWQLNKNNQDADEEESWNKKPVFIQEFIVATTETISSSNAPNNDLKEGQDKNYFCQWGKIGNKKEDKTCIIQKIQPTTDKLQTISLSQLNEKQILETPTKNDLNEKDNLFKLTITSHDGEISISKTQINIFSTITKNQKYISVKAIARLTHKKDNEEKKEDVIKTGVFMTVMISSPSSLLMQDININSTYNCRWTNSQATTIDQPNDSDLKPCAIYKIDTNNKNTIASKNDFEKFSDYIINFTDEKDVEPVSIFFNKNNDSTIDYVEFINATNKKNEIIGSFFAPKPVLWIQKHQHFLNLYP